MNNMLEFLSMNRIKNFDIIIDKSPLSLKVKVYKYYRFDDEGRSGDDFDLFGYSDKNLISTIDTKAIIDFNPSKAFLNAVGLFYENSLPILGFFKSSDNIMRQDVVEVTFKDVRQNRNNIVYNNRFVVVDILSLSFIAVYVYRLAPER